MSVLLFLKKQIKDKKSVELFHISSMTDCCIAYSTPFNDIRLKICLTLYSCHISVTIITGFERVSSVHGNIQIVITTKKLFGLKTPTYPTWQLIIIMFKRATHMEK